MNSNSHVSIEDAYDAIRNARFDYFRPPNGHTTRLIQRATELLPLVTKAYPLVLVSQSLENAHRLRDVIDPSRTHAIVCVSTRAAYHRAYGSLHGLAGVTDVLVDSY